MPTDIELESKIVNAEVKATYNDANKYGGGVLANRYLDEVHAELCSLSSADRLSVLKSLDDGGSYQMFSEKDGTPRGFLYDETIYVKTDDCKD